MSGTDYKLYYIESSEVVEHKNLRNLLRLKTKAYVECGDDFANWRDAKVIRKNDSMISWRYLSRGGQIETYAADAACGGYDTPAT